jgi:hypothetical protein
MKIVEFVAGGKSGKYVGILAEIFHLYRYSVKSTAPVSATSSVADPDPGSGAFLTPGSKI